MNFQVRHYIAVLEKEPQNTWYKTALAQLQEDRAELAARIATRGRK